MYAPLRPYGLSCETQTTLQGAIHHVMTYHHPAQDAMMHMAQTTQMKLSSAWCYLRASQPSKVGRNPFVRALLFTDTAFDTTFAEPLGKVDKGTKGYLPQII